MGHFDNLMKMKADYDAAVKAVGRDAVVDAFAPLFAEHPTAQAVRWSQYTPYFNDGDACTFRVGDQYIRFADSAEDAGEREDGFEDEYGYPDGHPKRAACKAIPKIPKDVMLAVFGDHVQVTVTRDGCEVEEYSHD